jgi:hypothetical protein
MGGPRTAKEEFVYARVATAQGPAVTGDLRGVSTLNRMPLKRRPASGLGVAAAGVTGFVDAVGQFEMHGLLVLKRGKVMAEAE